MSRDFSSLTVEEKLKYTLFAAVSEISDDVGKNNTLLGNFTVSSGAKELITELIWKKLEVHCEDLEAFAAHAKRKEITCDDVRLLFRRNAKLLEEFNKIDKEEESEDDDEEDEESGSSSKRACTSNNENVICLE